MRSIDPPAPDSGYPTPRDDIPSSSRSISPTTPQTLPITSTPVRNRTESRRTLKEHFSTFREDLSRVESFENRTLTDEENRSLVIKVIKPLLEMTKELKILKRENESLREESMRIVDENQAFKQIITEHETPAIPKLIFDFDNLKLKDEIKKELTSSFVRIDGDRTVLEQKLKEMMMPAPKVVTATATIQVDAEKTDADVQTETFENEDGVVSTSLQIELDDLTSKLEITEKEKLNLENRLFDYEKLKETFEENEQKLKEDLDKLHAKRDRNQKRITDLEERLSTIRKENEQIREENRKLVEESKVHEFEMDEKNSQIDELRKKVEANEKEISRLNDILSKEEEARKSAEEAINRLIFEHKQEIENMQKKIDVVLADGSSQSEKVKEMLEETREMVIETEKVQKENEYLTASQKALIESEMSLKNDIGQLSSSLKNSENQLIRLEESLKIEKNQRKLAENEGEELKMKLQEMEDNKEEADDLLTQIKKSKEEIDFLRKELERKSSVSEEIEVFEKKLKERDEEIVKLRKEVNEKEDPKRVEQLIREAAMNEKQVETLKIEVETKTRTMGEIMEEAKNNVKLYGELQSYHRSLIDEYEDFKKNAMDQYYHEVTQRDEVIKNLQERLVELETYPGQNISVIRNNQSTQTVEVVAEKEYLSPSQSFRELNAKSPDRSSIGSLRSFTSDKSTIETKITRLISKLREYLEVDTQSSSKFDVDICSNVIELVECLTSDLSAPVAGASRFWETLCKRVKSLEKEWNGKIEKLEEEKVEMERCLNELEQEIEDVKNRLTASQDSYEAERNSHSEVLRVNRAYQNEREELNKLIDAKTEEAEANKHLALGFQEEYEYHLKQNEEKTKMLHDLAKAREEQRIEYENETRTLRERLEGAQHELQRRTRDRINRDDDRDTEIEELREGLRKMTEEFERAERNIKQLEEENKDLVKKNKFGRITNEGLIKNEKIWENMANCYREKNKERQHLLDFALNSLKNVKQKIDHDETRRIVNEAFDEIQNKSRVLNNRDKIDEVSLTVSETSGSQAVFEKIRRRSERKLTNEHSESGGRRVLSNRNKKQS